MEAITAVRSLRRSLASQISRSRRSLWAEEHSLYRVVGWTHQCHRLRWLWASVVLTITILQPGRQCWPHRGTWGCRRFFPCLWRSAVTCLASWGGDGTFLIEWRQYNCSVSLIWLLKRCSYWPPVMIFFPTSWPSSRWWRLKGRRFFGWQFWSRQINLVPTGIWIEES